MSNNKNCPAKFCLRCGMRFNRRTDRRATKETPEQYAKRLHCSKSCGESEYCQLHELVVVKKGDYYLTLDGKWTINKDEAKLFHPGNGKDEIKNGETRLEKINLHNQK